MLVSIIGISPTLAETVIALNSRAHVFTNSTKATAPPPSNLFSSDHRKPTDPAAISVIARQADSLKIVASSTEAAIAVIYPDIDEPYRSIFTNIVEGIEDRTKTRISSYAVGPNFNTQSLMGELRKQDIRVVIALGRQGLKVASALDKDVAIVAGGVFFAPEAEVRTMTVHSLAPDPNLLFGYLKNLAPTIRKIFVVYDPLKNAWLVRIAKDAAAQHGITLVAYEAHDLKTALKYYQEILNTADAKKDALWLPQDSTTVDESTVLPLILRESWDRSLTVFSSNVSHVRRGALFSLYPNNIELGRILASSAIGLLTSNNTGIRGVLPLKEVQTAINIRTASHLGINLSYKQQQGFDLIFPQP